MGWQDDLESWKQGLGTSYTQDLPNEQMSPPPAAKEWNPFPDWMNKGLSYISLPGEWVNQAAGTAVGKFGEWTGSAPDTRPFSVQMEEAVRHPTNLGETTPIKESLLDALSFGGGTAVNVANLVSPEAGKYAGAVAGPVAGFSSKMGLDPVTYGALGLLPIGSAAHKVISLAFTGQMGVGAFNEAKVAVQKFQEEGASPDTVSAAVEAILSAGMAGMGAHGLVSGRPGKPLKPSTEVSLAKAATDQMTPPPEGPWAQDARTEWVNPQTDATMKGIADLALQEATAHIAAKVADPSRIPTEIPQLPQEVIFSDTTLDGADISNANGAAWNGKIYLTTLGRARLLQSGDYGGLSREIRRIMSHEMAHILTGGDQPGAPMRDIITGEPVTVADARTGMEIPTAPEPHAFDDRLDDSTREYNQYFQEQEIFNALKQSQALNEQAQIIEGQRRLEGQIRPRAVQSSTAGSYGRDFLETAQGLDRITGLGEPRNLELEASTRPEVHPIQVGEEPMPLPAEEAMAPPPGALAGERVRPRPPAGPITERAKAEGLGAKPSFWSRLLGLRGQAEVATKPEPERPYSKALLGGRVEAPPSPAEKAFQRMRDWAYGVDRRGTTKGSPVFQGKDAVAGLEWLKNDLDAQRAKGTRLGPYIVDTLKLKPGLLASVHQGLAQERLRAKNAGIPVPDHVVKGLEILDHLRRNLGVTRLLGEGRRMERGRAENLLPGLTRRAAAPETPEAKADRLLQGRQEFWARKQARQDAAEGMAKTFLETDRERRKFTKGSQQYVETAKRALQMAERLLAPDMVNHLRANQKVTIQERLDAIHEDLFSEVERLTPPPGKPAKAGADIKGREEEKPKALLSRGGYPRIIPERTALETAVQERMKARAAGLGLEKAKPLVAGKPEPPKPITAAPLSEVKAKKGRAKAQEVEERYRLQEFEKRKGAIYRGEIKGVRKGVSKLTKAQEEFQKAELAKPHEPYKAEPVEINVRPGDLQDAVTRELPEKEFKLKEEYTPQEKEALKGQMRVLPREAPQDKAVETVRALLFGKEPEKILAGVNAADQNALARLRRDLNSKYEGLVKGKSFTLDLDKVRSLGFSGRMAGLVESHFRDVARRLGKGEFKNGIEALKELYKAIESTVGESGFRKGAGGPLGKGADVEKLAGALDKAVSTKAAGGPKIRAVPLKVPWGTRTSRMEHFKDWLQRDESQGKLAELLTSKKNMLVAVKDKLGKLPKDIENFIVPGEMIGKRRYFSAIQTIMNWEQARLNRLEAAVHYFDQKGNKARADRIQKLLAEYRPTTLAYRILGEVVQREGSITVRNRLGTESQQALLSTTRSERKFGTALEHPMLQAAGGKVAGTKIPDLLNLEGTKRAFPSGKRPGVGPEVETEIQQAMEKAISAKEEKAIEAHVAEELEGLEEFIPEVAGGIKVSKVGTGKYTGVTRRDVVPGALYEPRIQAPRTGIKRPARTVKAMEEALEEGAHPEPSTLSKDTREFLDRVPLKDIPSVAAKVGGRTLEGGERIPLRTAISSLVDRWVDAEKIPENEANAAIEYLRRKRLISEQKVGRGSAQLRKDLEAKLYPKGRPATSGADVAQRALEYREKHKAEMRKVPGSSEKSWHILRTIGNWLNVTRPIKTAVDVSNPLRNTWQLSSDQIVRDVGRLFGIGRIRSDRTFLGNVLDSVKAFGEGKHKELTDKLHADPDFKAANQLGVNFIFEGTRKAEGWIGKEKLDKVINHLSKVPGVAGAKWLIDGSERAYTYYQNKAMRDAFKYSMDYLDYLHTQKGHEVTPETIKDVVKHINNAGSRGKVFTDPKINEAMGYVLYSAQMNASRLRMLGNAMTLFRNYDPAAKHYAQMQSLRAIAGAVGVVGAVYSLAKLSGQDPKIETDPRSTDWGKVAIGDITFDGWGGNQQFLRAGSQILMRQQKERGTGLVKPRSVTDTISRFVQSKMAPGASLALAVLDKRNTSGQPVDIFKDPSGAAAQITYDMLVPMSVDDAMGILKERPEVSWLIPLMLLGEGVSEGQGAKEAWLGKTPGLRSKDVNVMRELRATGVTAPRLGRKVSIPGRDVFGRRKYYNLSPSEQAEFEGTYMPLVTDLLNKFITTEAYQKLPVDARRKRLFRYVHQLNIRYGAATQLRSRYRNLAKAGLLKASNVVPEGEED